MANTKKVPRRIVQYSSLQEALEDANRLANAEALTTGNWSKGQIFEHLATVMDIAVDGTDRKASFLFGLLGKYVIKPMIFKKGMTPGYQLPKWASNIVPEDQTDTGAALEHLRQATQRIRDAKIFYRHPFFGALDQKGWNTLLIRHAELHMSFIAEPAASQA